MTVRTYTMITIMFCAEPTSSCGAHSGLPKLQELFHTQNSIFSLI